jgi:type II secretory ATPase GspE/PulE/Tfp pilus assembly ATPase PilB-like protein
MSQPLSFYDSRPATLEEDPNTFWWPTPPFAAYPQVQNSTGPLASTLEGMNQKKNRTRLVHFDLQGGTINVQLTPGQKPIPLKFQQFRMLALDEPVKPEVAIKGDPHAALMSHHPVSPFVVQYQDGSVLRGNTIGHVEVVQGLFLFPPMDKEGAASRIFIPRHAYKAYSVGERVGEILLAQAKVTQGQINAVVDEQEALRKRKLGDVLVSTQIISPDQLIEAIDMQEKLPVMRLGESLVALGMISETQLRDALQLQNQLQGTPLGELLVKKGLVTRENLQMALAHKMGYPTVDTATFPVEQAACKAIPFAMADRLQILPLVVRNGRLMVAMEDPTRRSAIAELEFTAQCKVVATLAKLGTIPGALSAAYHHHGFDVSGSSMRGELAAIDGSALLAQMQSADAPAGDEVVNEKSIEQSDNQLVRLINTMIVEAHTQGVSDIHVECPAGKDKIRIRFRKDGALKNYLELPPAYRSALVARIKIMCDLDISERRRAQDGKINFAKYSPQHKLELRVATIPTANGVEDVVMRLLAASKPLPLDSIGLSPKNFEKLSWAAQRPYGMVLCVGPTGSGKTTTLHSVLGYINRPETKIWTAEDPVEITQVGLRQVQVNPKIDWTFAKALKSFLRADPDVIMVGEVRDAETAHMAIEASLTGHLVMSTLHTNSAPETITRLLDMGMDPFNFADSLLAVLAQRLGRRLCKACKTSTPATQEQIDELLDDFLYVYTDRTQRPRDALLAEWVERFGVNGQLMHHHSPGCDKCDQRGYAGRVGLHELLTVSRDLRRMIQKGARAEEIQHQALSEGMQTLRQDGLEKVLQGLTSLEEVRAMSNA